jgi:hypothetical protein
MSRRLRHANSNRFPDGTLGKSRTTQSAAPSSPQALTNFELMSKSKNLPVAPHAEAF